MVKGCAGCPIRCKRAVRTEFAGRKVDPLFGGPEYETTAAFGSLCMNADLDAISLANQLCNDYGLDTISAGVAVAFLMEASEKGLIEETIGVEEIPQIWNEKMERYIGLTPPNDRLGCLQDVHWSEGYIGYFPTYAIGSILAAQVGKALERELGLIEELVKEGRFGDIARWLGERIHRWGATYPPKELVRRALGESLNPRYFLEYLKRKYLKGA